MSETASVQKTNTVSESERDIAQLDRLLREKPNCTTMSFEAMIMFSNNKTSKWIGEKSPDHEEMEQLFKQAREKGPVFRKALQNGESKVYIIISLTAIHKISLTSLLVVKLLYFKRA